MSSRDLMAYRLELGTREWLAFRERAVGGGEGEDLVANVASVNGHVAAIIIF